ncbi:UNVERIFIED_ORG: hypothetical protein BDU10_3467 [Burkholderia sp. CF145]
MSKPAPRRLTEEDAQMIRAVAEVNGWNAGELAKRIGPGVVTRQAIDKILSRKTYADVPQDSPYMTQRRAGRFGQWQRRVRVERGLQAHVAKPSERELANWKLAEDERAAEQLDRDAAERATFLERRIQCSVTCGRKWWAKRLAELIENEWDEGVIAKEFEKHLRFKTRCREQIVAKFNKKPPVVGKAREKRLAKLKAQRAAAYEEWMVGQDKRAAERAAVIAEWVAENGPGDIPDYLYD